MENVRCALIGYGAWGRHHAEAIAMTAGAELTAVCARSEQSRAAAAADHPAARVYADHREMLSRENLNLCDVVIPSDQHFAVARDVLESGRHLLLEKPMALRAEHCAELHRLATSRRRVLAVGHELRHSSLWGKVKELIDAGRVGEPLYAMIELWRRPYRLGSGGWRYDVARVGDWVLEEPIHFFDLARWYFQGVGEPQSVYAAASGRDAARPELHDNFSAVVQFSRGRYAVISQTLAAWEHHQTVKLTGTHGAIWATWGGAIDRTRESTSRLRLQRGTEAPVEDVPIDKRAGEVYELVDEMASVVRAVREGTPVACNALDGWWSTAMCLGASRSLAEARPVALEKIPPNS